MDTVLVELNPEDQKRLQYFPQIQKVTRDGLFDVLEQSGVNYTRRGNLVEVNGDTSFTLILWENVVYH